ncbi:MAG: 6-phosphogluconolactonase [Pseudomonadota bacterium]
MRKITETDTRDNINWQCLADADAVATHAADLILQAAVNAIHERGVFHLVLAGGRTPGKVYQRLAKAQADWKNWQLYFGDERCLPADHPERNSRMAANAWLDNGAIPVENIHSVPAERGAETAATNYSSVIDHARPFDLVLLGMGEDGHTASLFPGQLHPDTESVHAIHNAPKPPPDRVSLSRSSLSDSRDVLVLITGTGKRTAVQQWQSGEALPIAGITARHRMTVLVDEAAAARITGILPPSPSTAVSD